MRSNSITSVPARAPTRNRCYTHIRVVGESLLRAYFQSFVMGSRKNTGMSAVSPTGDYKAITISRPD